MCFIDDKTRCGYSNILDEIRDGNLSLLSSFDFDANGNMILSNTERNYSWDYANRMRAYYNMPSGAAEPTKYTRYYYDGAGNRVKKVVYDSYSNTYESTTYIDGVFDEHYRSSTDETKNYYHIEGGVEIRAGGFEGEDVSVGSNLISPIIYQLADHLNSCTVRLNDVGGVIDREEYYPYGETSLHTFSKKRYRFTGKEKDGESGLYYSNFMTTIPWVLKYTKVFRDRGRCSKRISIFLSKKRGATSAKAPLTLNQLS